jgi:GT2 family glycosyltransferase
VTGGLSVLILSWNTRELTERCLDSLPQLLDRHELYEVIVVDNASSDGSAEMLAARSDITLIRNDDNRGYAGGVNQAYGASRGELVLLLNSDVVFLPGAIEAMLRFLDDKPEAAGVAPSYRNPDGSPQPQHARLPTFGALLGNVSALLGRLPPLVRLVRRYKMLDDDFSRPRPVEQPAASCLLLRRSVIGDAPMMDESFPIYFNDVELAHRIRANGSVLWMTPDAVVVHELGASTRHLGAALARHHVGGMVRYLSVVAGASRLRLLALRAVILIEYVARAAVRHPGALPLRELWCALRGDPGPVPQAVAKP